MNLSELSVRIAVQGAEAAKRNLHTVRDALADTAEKAAQLSAKARPVGDFLRGVASGAAASAAALFGVQAALFGVAAVAGFQSAKQLDSLTRGLASVSVDAADLTAQLGRLREVAKLPGLGFAEAVQGSLSLQAAGLSAELAERSLKAFGNALATVGKGKSDLDGVTLALSQIASKGKVSAEEINQINERVPQIRAAMNAAFGTADGDAINKMGVSTTRFIGDIVSELEKLPAVSGGVGNAVENLQDKLQAALLPLGKGLTAMFEAASPGLEKLLNILESRMTAIGEVFQAVGKSGVLAETLQSILGLNDSIGDFKNGAVDAVATVLTVIGNIPAAFQQVQSYTSELFRVLSANASATGEFIGAKLAEVWGRIQSFIGAGVEAVATALGTAGDAIGQYLPGVGQALASLAVGLFKLTPTGAVANALFADSAVAAPVYESLPGVPDVLGTLGSGRDEKAKRIRAALSPLSELPDGLNFGGGAKDGGTSPIVAALDAIETNTARTADALSLKRQITGGGELGRLGVTPAELFGGSGHVSGAATGDMWAQTADLMRRAARQEAQKQGATGLRTRFAPR